MGDLYDEDARFNFRKTQQYVWKQRDTVFWPKTAKFGREPSHKLSNLSTSASSHSIP